MMNPNKLNIKPVRKIEDTPVASNKEIKIDYSLTAEWLSGFQRYVYDILANVIFEEERRKKYVSQAGMEIFIQSVTHESVNPSVNYEQLETVGDGIAKGIFFMYLRKRFNNINEEQFTNLTNYYLSREQQAEIATKIGLDKWIRAEIITKAIKEDVFESFLGAIWEVTEKVENNNMGRAYINCYNFFVFIFNDINIDFVKAIPATTFVQQVLEQFALGKPIIKERVGDNGYHFEIYYPDQAIKFFADYGFSLDSLIGSANGKTAKEARKNAYSNAFSYLFSRGLTPTWIEKQKEELTLKRPEIIDLLPQVSEKFRNDGYIKLYFKQPTNSRSVNQILMDLIGVKVVEGGNMHRIITSVKLNFDPRTTSKGEIEAKARRQLLVKYLDMN